MPDSLITRTRRVLKTEGSGTLALKALRFLKSKFFPVEFGSVDLFENTLRHLDEARYRTDIKELSFFVISSNAQLDEVVGSGFEDPRKCNTIDNVQRGLEKGALAFCFFIGRDLAHIGWMAMTPEAKTTFDTLPYRVEFDSGQACTGGTVTLPKFRGNGLMTYGQFKRLEFLRERGFTASRNAVKTNNAISHRVHFKMGSRIYARARYVKIGRRILWKELPVEPSDQH
jgi:hypothetical protein